MKILLTFIFILTGFVLGAHAQACGKFSVNIIVQDESGKPVDNAIVQFLPITRDETYGKQFVRDKSEPSRFSIEFFEGQGVKEFHKLVISADGYKTAENEIKFPSCRGPYVTVKLPKKDSAAAAVWNFKNLIMVETQDVDGEPVSGVKVIIKKDGKIVEEETMEYFGSGFTLLNGEYVFRFEKDGYQPQEIKVDVMKIAGQEIKTKLEPKK